MKMLILDLMQCYCHCSMFVLRIGQLTVFVEFNNKHAPPIFSESVKVMNS